MTSTMRAAVIDAPGGPDALVVKDVPIPAAPQGWVRIKVMAFGLNRSELHFRSGVAYSGSFPRIPGIEAVGTIDEDVSGTFTVGQQVATMMGGMGREFDGGYAEFVAVPLAQVIPFESALGWDILGAVPEMLQTAFGSIAVGVRPESGHTMLIRGGTSSVGLAAAVVAKLRGVTVIATTRSADRFDLLRSVGVDHPIVDDGHVAERVREIAPGGADGAIELIGVNVLRDTLQSVRSGATVCFTGMLSDQWTIDEFYPLDWLPNGVRLTAYSGEASDLPAHELQAFLDAVADGRARVPIGRVYRLDDIAVAHADMEAGTVGGKAVVVL